MHTRAFILTGVSHLHIRCEKKQWQNIHNSTNINSLSECSVELWLYPVTFTPSHRWRHNLGVRSLLLGWWYIEEMMALCSIRYLTVHDSLWVHFFWTEVSSCWRTRRRYWKTKQSLGRNCVLEEGTTIGRRDVLPAARTSHQNSYFLNYFFASKHTFIISFPLLMFDLDADHNLGFFHSFPKDTVVWNRRGNF